MDYQGNSHKAREEAEKPKNTPEKKVQKVIKGEVVKKKKPMGSKFKSMIFAADFETVSNYVFADVILPRLRDLLFDTIRESAAKSIYNRGGGVTRGQVPYSGRVQYNTSPIHQPDPRTQSYPQANLPDQRIRPARRNLGEEYPMASRSDAEDVLDQLVELIDMYQVASLADFYEMLGLESSPIDNKWGWSVMRNVSIDQVREGYVIKLPPLEDIS
jgi:hypothetical protein